jgi:hypothetical protein
MKTTMERELTGLDRPSSSQSFLLSSVLARGLARIAISRETKEGYRDLLRHNPAGL